MALGLREPIWTSDGEVMNNDRFAFYGGPTHDAGLKYVREEKEPELFHKLLAFITQIVQAEGVAYKDVVNPFVLSAFLRDNDIPVIKIKRCLADVYYSMLRIEWFYPARAAEKSTCLEGSVMEGLIRAEKAIDAIAGEVIRYDEIIEDEQTLRDSLIRLYPGEKVRRARFIDDDFRNRSKEIFKRREADLYRAIARKIETIKRDLD